MPFHKPPDSSIHKVFVVSWISWEDELRQNARRGIQGFVGTQVKSWLEATKRKAHDQGEVHVMSGRRRPMRAINSSDSRRDGWGDALRSLHLFYRHMLPVADVVGELVGMSRSTLCSPSVMTHPGPSSIRFLESRANTTHFHVLPLLGMWPMTRDARSTP